MLKLAPIPRLPAQAEEGAFHSAFIIPHSSFRIHHSASRSSFRIPLASSDAAQAFGDAHAGGAHTRKQGGHRADDDRRRDLLLSAAKVAWENGNLASSASRTTE